MSGAFINRVQYSTNTDGEGSREGGAVLAKKRKVSSIRSRIRITV
jgi:hypothetical protein